MAGNVILGGLIGAGLDVATGATNGLSPNPIEVKLVPLKPESGNEEQADARTAQTSRTVDNDLTDGKAGPQESTEDSQPSA